MPHDLESPRTPDELYLARGDDVCAARPVLTGDIIDDVEVTEPDGSRRAAASCSPSTPALSGPTG